MKNWDGDVDYAMPASIVISHSKDSGADVNPNFVEPNKMVDLGSVRKGKLKTLPLLYELLQRFPLKLLLHFAVSLY